MADNLVSFQIQGLDSLLGKLENLKFETKKKGGRSALRKAAQLVRDAARQNAQTLDDPGTDEQISKNIVERWNGRLNKRTGDLGFRIGVLGGARGYSAYGEIKTGKNSKANPGGDTFYWRFLEFGTQSIPARPFMRPALAENVSNATDTFVREYDKVIDRAIKRARKKGTVI
jgi:HK97 gp10 family phage protein